MGLPTRRKQKLMPNTNFTRGIVFKINFFASVVAFFAILGIFGFLGIYEFLRIIP
jgi:hypothetical protein